MRAGQNPVDILCNLPSVAPAGSFFVTDPLGRSPYGYCGFGQSLFYQVNLYSGALQRLPDFAAGLVFGAGVCAAYDADRNRVWVFGPGTGAGVDSYTGYYNIATGAWVARDLTGDMDALLGATWGTDGSLVHLAAAENAAWSGDAFYLRGSGLNTAYAYDVAGDAWTAIAVPGVASGAGVTMSVAWGFSDDLVYSTHGGGSVVKRQYSIGGAAWATVPSIPAFTDLLTTGTCATTHPNGRDILYRVNATGQIFAWNGPTNGLLPYARIYGPDGTATVGNKMCAWRQNGDTYLGVIIHSSAQIQRIRIVE